ncbi:lipopolysaccharide biosynthesis protein [Shewanella sp. Actino-trap-3]|uniref:lipopolysaccharide biosynthesis protein n=1 Tax=Shewanella sp. Actino-trap-3 TaxID=2058331 RepID=UPI0012FEA061|nr:oligosaccharide flippase family protein [Shewanella sp. Actino-trap-3]
MSNKPQIFRSSFSRNIGKLMGSGIFVGILGALCLPIISRIYAPEDLGSLQLLISMILVLSSLSTFRLEEALILPTRMYRTEILYILSILALIVSTVFFGFVFYIFSDYIFTFFNLPMYSNYVLVVPFGCFVVGLSQITQMRFVASGSYSQLSINKISQSLTNNIGSIGLGYNVASLTSLIVSYLMSFLLVVMIYFLTNKSRKISAKCYSKKMLFRYLVKYKKYPTINLAGSFLNNLSYHMPVFVLSKSFGHEAVGFYMMANKLLDMPMALVASSISQVYMKYAADAFNKGGGELMLLYKSTLKKLLIISVPYLFVFLGLYFIGVELVLGRNWHGVNVIIILLLCSKVAQLVTSPISTTLNVVDKQEYGLFFICIFLVLRYALLESGQSLNVAIILYSLATSIFYLVINYFVIVQLLKFSVGINL